MIDERQMLKDFKEWMECYSPDWIKHFSPGEVEPMRKCWFAATRKAQSLNLPEDTCRRDTARLDWLSNMDGPFGDFDTFSTADLIASHEYKGKQYSTLRDALDAAMEAFARPQLPAEGSK